MTKKYKIKATTYDSSGRKISSKQNSYQKTHPTQAYFAKLANSAERIVLHAEVRALLDAKRQRKTVDTIVVERYDTKGNPALAKPCEVCELFIRHCGVKKVIYTSKDGLIEWRINYD